MAEFSSKELLRKVAKGERLERADLRGIQLEGASLVQANLARADLTGANLTGANLTGPKWKAVIELLQEQSLTPMIDIVFQLVLFFMVSTTFISSPGFQVDLPRSSAQTQNRRKTDSSFLTVARVTRRSRTTV